MANKKDDEYNCISFVALCVLLIIFIHVYYMLGLADSESPIQFTSIYRNFVTPSNTLCSLFMHFPGDANPKPYAHYANKQILLITFWLHMANALEKKSLHDLKAPRRKRVINSMNFDIFWHVLLIEKLVRRTCYSKLYLNSNYNFICFINIMLGAKHELY